MKRIILLLLLLCKFTFASFDMNENMQSSYTYIIGLEFNAARNNIAIEQTTNPDNGFIQLHQNYIDFLTVIIGEDLIFFENTEKKKAERLSKLKENNKSSPYYLYSQAELHLQWAFARLKFEDYIPAAYEFVKAYYLLEKNTELYPNFTLNKKGLGLLHSLLGAVPNQYHWILNIAGLQGDVDLGFSELSMVLEDSECKMYKNEVLFLVSLLQINLKNNNSVCQEYLDRIGDGYTTNYLLNFAAARLSYNIGQNDYCLKVLANRPSSTGKYPFYFLDYLQGMSYLCKLDYEKSKQSFMHYIDHFKGINYIKSSYHKLAWIAELQNDPSQKKYNFDKSISEGDEYIDVDKVALKEAKKSYISHPVLLRSRLLYDGGYYLEALAQLQEKIFLDNPEYFYRIARVKSKLDFENLEVISAYQKSVELSKKSTDYYGPMSILQIGFIYEQANEFKNAKDSFNKCLSMSNFDYERGIHQKAKAGIDRIKN
jgi:hypothetical protein